MPISERFFTILRYLLFGFTRFDSLLMFACSSKGSSPALFVGTTAFEVIIKQQIRRIEEPSLKCATLVFDELVRILNQLLTKNVRSIFFLRFDFEICIDGKARECRPRSSVTRPSRIDSTRLFMLSTRSLWFLPTS